MRKKRPIPWFLIGALLILVIVAAFLFTRPRLNEGSPTMPAPSLPQPSTSISTLAPLPELPDPAAPFKETPANYELITRENAADLELLGQIGEGILGDDFDLSPDGKTLAISSGGGVILADAETMRRIGFIPLMRGAWEVDISPDGSKLAVSHSQVGNESINAQGAGEIKLIETFLSIYDLPSQQLQTRIRLREGDCAGTSAEDLQFSSDGKFIAIFGFTPRNLPNGGSALCFYTAFDGGLEHIFQPRDAYGGIVLFNREGRLLYTFYFESLTQRTSNCLAALDLIQRSMVRKYPIPLETVQDAHLTSDGQRILISDYHCMGWLNPNDGSWSELPLPDLQQQDIEKVVINEDGSRIAVVFWPQGKIYLLDGNSGAVIWGPLDSKLYPTWDGQQLSQYALQSSKLIISPDGQSLYQLYQGHSLRKLSLLDGSVQAVLGGLSEKHIYAVNPDASQAAFGGYSDNSDRVWSLFENRELFSLEGHTGMVRGIAYSPDGAQIGTVSEDGTLRLWDAQSGALLQTLNANTGAAWALDFSPDGSLVASCGDDDQLRIWSPQDGTLLKSLSIGGSGQSHRILHLLPDNNSALIASYCFHEETCPAEAMTGDLLQMDLNTGQILERFPEMTFGLETSRDGQFMGVVSARRGWCYGNPLTNPGALRCLANGYTGLGVSPDGALYFSTNGQHIQVYDSISGDLITEKSPGMDYARTRVSPDQKILWVSGARLQFWAIPQN